MALTQDAVSAASKLMQESVLPLWKLTQKFQRCGGNNNHNLLDLCDILGTLRHQGYPDSRHGHRPSLDLCISNRNARTERNIEPSNIHRY